MQIRTLIAAAALAGLLPVAASAQYGTYRIQDYFDVSKRVTITGSVVSFKWLSSFSEIWLDMTDAQGSVVRWKVETHSANALRTCGWSRDTLVQGDLVTIEGVPSLDGTRTMRALSVTHADGRRFPVPGLYSDGCRS